MRDHSYIGDWIGDRLDNVFVFSPQMMDDMGGHIMDWMEMLLGYPHRYYPKWISKPIHLSYPFYGKGNPPYPCTPPFDTVKEITHSDSVPLPVRNKLRLGCCPIRYVCHVAVCCWFTSCTKHALFMLPLHVVRIATDGSMIESRIGLRIVRENR
jgi:hypothetical protein